MVGPWKKIAEGYGKMVLGYFGKTPVQPDAEIVKIASEQMGLEPTDRLVVDINDEDPKKGIAAATELLKKENLPVNDENIFIAAACKEKGIQYLKGEARVGVRKIDKAAAQTEQAPAASAAADGYTVTVNNKTYSVKLEGGKAVVNGTSYDISVKEGIDAGASAAPAAAAGPGTEVKAPMPGLILRLESQVGEEVSDGQLLLVMEAMKMETEIFAPCAGTIREIKVSQGDQKKAGDVLVVIA